MSLPAEDPQCSTIPEQSLLPWPETRKLKYPALPNEWQHFPHPKELEYLPDGPQTPYELRQIVKRSLYKHQSQSSPSQQIQQETQPLEAQPDHASYSPPAVTEKQRRNSSTSAESRTTCTARNATLPAATGDATSLIPSPLHVSNQNPRYLKPKSSFLASKLERRGAKREKLEHAISKRSLQSPEEGKVVTTA